MLSNRYDQLKRIRGNHSESAANNLLVFVDESKAKGMNVYLELKSLLTTKELLINPKHVRPYKQETFSRFMFADNTEGRAFNIEQEDRRIYVMEYVIHEENKKETQEFVSDFLDWFNVNWQLVHGYLINYDLSNWSPHVCPMTDAKKEYLHMCEDIVPRLLAEYMATGQQSIDELRWNHLIETNELGDEYYWVKLMKEGNLKYALENAGYQYKRVCERNSPKLSAYFLSGLKGKDAYRILIEERSPSTGRVRPNRNSTSEFDQLEIDIEAPPHIDDDYSV